MWNLDAYSPLLALSLSCFCGTRFFKFWYEYRFSTFQEKKEQGNWWNRQWVEPYSPILSLKNQESDTWDGY